MVLSNTTFEASLRNQYLYWYLHKLIQNYNDNDHCEGFKIIIRNMKKFEKAWFRIDKQWLEGDKHLVRVPDNGTWIELIIEEAITKIQRSMPI